MKPPDLNQETWLAERVTKLISAVFAGTTDPSIRRDRMRRAIIAGGVDMSICKKADGKTETIAQLFERVYGEPLETPKKKGDSA